MKTGIAAAAVAAVLSASMHDANANDQKAARKAPAAQRAKNMSEAYLETLPGALPGGVRFGPEPVTPMGGGTGGRTGDAPEPAPGQPSATSGSSPEPAPVATNPVGEAPPPPAPPPPYMPCG